MMADMNISSGEACLYLSIRKVQSRSNLWWISTGSSKEAHKHKAKSAAMTADFFIYNRGLSVVLFHVRNLLSLDGSVEVLHTLLGE